jgi:hypothetical protein
MNDDFKHNLRFKVLHSDKLRWKEVRRLVGKFPPEFLL